MKSSLSDFLFLDLNKPSSMASPIQLFVGDHWLVIHGTSFDTELHRHHAAQWAFLADGNVSATTATGDTLSGRGLFVPPNLDHAFKSTAPVLMVFWEPEHDLVRGYMNQIRCSEIMPCDIPDELPVSWTDQAASKIANACVKHDSENHVVNQGMDARVCLAQRLIHQQLDQPLHLEDIAQKVHIIGKLYQVRCQSRAAAHENAKRGLSPICPNRKPIQSRRLISFTYPEQNEKYDQQKTNYPQ